MRNICMNPRVGGHAGRTPALLSLATERESVPPVYKHNSNRVSWRRARRFARAIMTAHSLVYEQIEEQIRYTQQNIILRSADLEKFLPSKAYTDVYAFRNADFVADIRLAK